MPIDYGVQVDGRHGFQQIDSEYPSMTVLAEGTIPFVSYHVQGTNADWYGFKNQLYWAGGNEYYGSLIPVPKDDNDEFYDSADLLVFIVPDIENRVNESGELVGLNSSLSEAFAIEWVANPNTNRNEYLHIYGAEKGQYGYNVFLDIDGLPIKYIIATIAEVADDTSPDHAEYGLQINNQYGNCVFSSNKKNFSGEDMFQGMEPTFIISGYDDVTANSYAVGFVERNTSGLVFPYEQYQWSIPLRDQDPLGYKDTYALMNPTLQMHAWQTMGRFFKRYADCEYFQMVKFVYRPFNQDTQFPQGSEIRMGPHAKLHASRNGDYFSSPVFFWQSVKALIIGKFR